jgi:hypothetical protein
MPSFEPPLPLVRLATARDFDPRFAPADDLPDDLLVAFFAMP